MNDKSVMTARQGAELDHAFERNGWTAAMVKKLSEGDMLFRMLPILNDNAEIVVRQRIIDDNAEIVVRQRIIDGDADPFIPNGWTVEEHQKCGQFEFDPRKVELYLTKEQRSGLIDGNVLRKRLSNKSVFNANVLDYLLRNPQFIPEEWKVEFLLFWGTIYRESYDRLCVRYLHWDGIEWKWGYNWIGHHCNDCHTPALVFSTS